MKDQNIGTITNNDSIKASNTEHSSTSIVVPIGYGREWSTPEQIETHEYDDHIEVLYKEQSVSANGFVNMEYNYNYEPSVRIFKIVFSCIDGKWNKSEKIYGKIIPAQEEYYEFDGE